MSRRPKAPVWSGQVRNFEAPDRRDGAAGDQAPELAAKQARLPAIRAAELIVRSVNAHAARVEALELALEALKVLGLPRDYHLNHAERMLRETLQGVVQL